VNKRLIPGTPKKNRKTQHCHYSRKRQNRLQKPKSNRLRIVQKIKTDQAHKIVRVLHSSCATKRSTKRETGTRSFELANKKGGGKKKAYKSRKQVRARKGMISRRKKALCTLLEETKGSRMPETGTRERKTGTEKRRKRALKHTGCDHN
jgi:hypothetical protein